jgi:GT2 family glycosyltransferase
MITIVSLAWNQAKMTEQFLSRLRDFTDIPHKLIFTDNHSEEDIPSLVREYYPDARLIVKDKNVGCPATRNEAMRYATTPIVFWLDNDCMVGPKWYEPVMRELEHPNVGISGPQGYVVKNPWQQPYPFEAVTGGDCDYFMGWLVGFKRRAYKPINDYQIPVNLDDVELCWGIKSNGLRAKVCEPCFAKHLTSQTGRGWEFNDQEKLAQLWANWPDKTIFEKWK